LYSAFLARHIEPDTFVLQVSQLLEDWQSAELCLQAAWRTATGAIRCSVNHGTQPVHNTANQL
jgi:hypothetical protein